MSFSRSKAASIAAELLCTTALVLAFSQVESGGRKDLPDGRPQILFEAQWFSKFTNGIYDLSNPNISSPYWNKTLYRGGAAEYDRLAEAMALNKTAALKSCSWGIFQVMGFNHKRCGFATVEEFVEFIKGPDDNDMVVFTNFCKADNNLIHAIRILDFEKCAELYNGTGQIPYYAGELREAYEEFSVGSNEIAYVPDTTLRLGSKGPAVKALQRALGSYYPIFADGDYGQKTYDAVLKFQAAQSEIGRMDGVGVAGKSTLSALKL